MKVHAEVDGLPEGIAKPNKNDLLQPFVVGSRKYTMRHGPHAMPFPGMGCFVMVSAEPVFTMIFPIRQMIDKGGMVHLDQFSDSLESKGIICDSSKFPTCMLGEEHVALGALRTHHRLHQLR